MRKLAWGARVPALFRAKIYAIVLDLGWDLAQADDLMACIAFESAETFSSSVRNAAGSGAVGLIQFMPATAKGLGTTTQQLAAMSATDQLTYVYKYFLPYRKRIKTLSDMYMAILMPRFIGADNNAIVFNKDTIAYAQNKGLDLNKNGVVTKEEATSKVYAKLQKGLLEENLA